MVEQIISYVDSYHYLDDVRVAGNYIRVKKEYKSKRELEFLLKQKGISESDILIAMDENYVNDDGISQEELAISRQLHKYRITEAQLEERSYEEKQKAAAKLYRKGFDSEKIRKLLQM
jgi:regulatory protein